MAQSSTPGASAETSSRPVCLDPATAKPPARRTSRAARWRTFVLVLVHVLVAIHIAHWLTTGSTVSPLEPSEAMRFSKESVINAGLVFFALAALSTLVLGRFFCGWGCHVVALQDASRWILMKVGIKPRPLRSRWLALVPLGAFAYMFLWPFVVRIALGGELGPVETEMTTEGFWDTFPGLVVGVTTLFVAGFVCVYFLGAKGYCTYACPYGALFGFADRFAPGRIRVTDACEQCGHCTQTCSSNVRVHEEVWRYGMVVDAGCMKCMDCVSVCPKEALYFGFGRPAVGAKPAKPARGKLPKLSFVDEAILLVAFAAAMACFYKPMPFLFALGVSSVLALVVLQCVRLARGRDVGFVRWSLRRDGRLTRPGGVIFVGLAIVIGVWWLHTGLVRVARIVAERGYESTAYLMSGTDPYADPVALQPEDEAVVRRALAASRFVDTVDLRRDGTNAIRLSWLSWLLGDEEAASHHLEQALRWSPENRVLRADAVRFYVSRNDTDAALRIVRENADADADGPASRLRYATILAGLGRLDEAAGEFTLARERWPDDEDVAVAFGNFERERGNPDVAIEILRSAVAARPNAVNARRELGLALASVGRAEEGLGHALEAARLAPERADVLAALAAVHLAVGEASEALERVKAALALDATSVEAYRVLARILHSRGDLEGSAEARARAESLSAGRAGAASFDMRSE